MQLLLRLAVASTSDVLEHGARGDGVADNSAAIAAAFAACSGGGAGNTVLFRTGHTFRSGPIEMSCNDSVVALQAGARIVARNSTAGWPFGMDCPEPAQGMSPRQMAPLLWRYARNVSLQGGGEVDANGEMWWAGACSNEVPAWPGHGHCGVPSVPFP